MGSRSEAAAANPEALRVRLAVPRAEFELTLDLTLPARGATVLFGPSGSGKTTLLRCVAGLERAPAGDVRLGADIWQDEARGRFVPTWQRPLGYVFQEASLFEHLDVRANLHYGLKRTRAPGAAAMLKTAIGLLGIEPLLARAPAQLSGGERQRVAIARALATGPRLLLLDEPLSALDWARRQEVLPWLERLRDELGLPMLYVTHSAAEMARLADHLVVLERGRVKAQGAVADVLAEIETPVLAGDEAGVLLAGRVAELEPGYALARVAFDGGSLWLRDSGLALGQAVRLRVLARDVSIALVPPQHSSIQNLLACRIESFRPDSHPSQVLVRAQVGASWLLARITAKARDGLQLRPGLSAWLQVKSVALVQ